MNEIISILGTPSELIPISRNQLQGLNADMLLRFAYYATEFNGERICVIRPKNSDVSTTPLRYKRMSEQIEAIVGLPVAISLDSVTYYERERLIKQGVYFIISDKYAFLPGLVANARARKTARSNKLLPASQYILLYYLLTNEQVSTIKELENKMPYNYVALARAITNLEDCKLCSIQTDNTRTKHIIFNDSRRDLWVKAQRYLSSPVKKILYSDHLPKGYFSTSGVTALSYYSHLNPEKYETVAIWDKQFQREQGRYNEIEGLYKIEIWKYPVTMPYHAYNSIVDKLSLYLSMKDDPDARIEKELEILIEEMQW